VQTGITWDEKMFELTFTNKFLLTYLALKFQASMGGGGGDWGYDLKML